MSIYICHLSSKYWITYTINIWEAPKSRCPWCDRIYSIFNVKRERERERRVRGKPLRTWVLSPHTAGKAGGRQFFQHTARFCQIWSRKNYVRATIWREPWERIKLGSMLRLRRAHLQKWEGQGQPAIYKSSFSSIPTINTPINLLEYFYSKVISI